MNDMKPIAKRLLTVSCVWTILLFVSRLQTIGAMDIAREDSAKLLEYFRTQERLLDEAASSEPQPEFEDDDFSDDLEREVEYEDDLEDDYGLSHEDEAEDDSLTMEDVEDLMLARKVLEEMRSETNKRSLTYAVHGANNIVTPDDSFYFFSHDNFGTTRYPNRAFRKWTFTKAANVEYVKIYCPFFRIQWSQRCRRDKFTVFKHPYNRGIRRCGQIHGFWKKYDISIRVIFKSNWYIRRAGFTCVVSGVPYPKTYTSTTSTTTATTTTATTTTSTTSTSTTSSTTTTYAPGCPVAPVEPDVRAAVTTCADILPGYSYCTCTDITGGICLQCSICSACDMEFFAVHDFSSVNLYVSLYFNCPQYPIDANALSFGFTSSVKGYVLCFPIPSHVVQPSYPPGSSGVTLIVMSCPVPVFINVCDLFESGGIGRRLLTGASYLASHRGEMIGGPHQKSTLQSLADLPPDTENLEIVELVADLSTLTHPEIMKNLIVIDTFCEMFPDRNTIDLTSFTSLETLKLELCITSCPVGSISLNSDYIDTVTLILPNVTSAEESCVTNQGTTTVGLPVINIY